MERVRIIALLCLFRRFYVPKFSYKQIKNIVEGVDVVHLMGHWTFMNALVYLAAHSLNKPYVVCPAGALPIFGRSWFIKKMYNILIGNKIILNAWGHVAIPHDEIKHFQAYGVAPENVTVIPNGINAEDFKSADVDEFRRKHHLADYPIILFVGRLNPIKGPDLLLEAFSLAKRKLPHYHLVFAGPDGGMLAELKNLADNFDLGERIHFIGYVGGDQKSQAYHAADILIIPSRQEAMSIVVLEAGITGTPVLLTDKCGFDLIGEINGGMVVEASAEALSEGIITLLKDTKKLQNMGKNLKRYVQENYTWEIIIKRYISMYETILMDTEK
ncbi:MAG: glycosyltransferase family 4 protein [Candidatus Altiarchaeota archaeon]|nr:glycosyltransferase family 4 protein [Candidatus Altiarchaeota archaeon]